MAEARTANERRARRRAEQTLAVPQPPWGRFQNPLPPLEISERGGAEADRGHGLPRARGAGSRVHERGGARHPREERRRGRPQVRHGQDRPRDHRKLVGLAPRSIEMHARNPERDLIIGGNYINFTPVGSAPNVCDLDRGRRPGAVQRPGQPDQALPEPQLHPLLGGHAGRGAGPAGPTAATSTSTAATSSIPTASGRPAPSAASACATASSSWPERAE